MSERIKGSCADEVIAFVIKGKKRKVSIKQKYLCRKKDLICFMKENMFVIYVQTESMRGHWKIIYFYFHSFHLLPIRYFLIPKRYEVVQTRYIKVF